MPSAGALRAWLPEVASVACGFRWVDSLDSSRNPPCKRGLPRKALKMSQKFRRSGCTGFRVDSPVKKPDAGKLTRSAPPYTDRAREEPWEGEHAIRLVRKRWQYRRGQPIGRSFNAGRCSAAVSKRSLISSQIVFAPTSSNLNVEIVLVGRSFWAGLKNRYRRSLFTGAWGMSGCAACQP